MLSLVSCFFCWLLVSNISSAQTTSTIAVSPAIFDVAAQPGEQTSITLTIRNENDTPLPVSIAIQSFVSNETGDFYINPAYDAKQWLKLESDSYVLASNEVKKIPVTVSVPYDVSPGGHYAQISVRGLSFEADPSLSGESLVIPEVNASVFITVAGDIYESFRIQKQNLVPFQATPQSTITSVFSVKNDSNVHNLITPKIIISENNNVISEYILLPRVILPDSVVQLSHTWDIPDEYGRYNVLVGFLYGNDQQQVTSKKEIVHVTPPLSKLVGLAVLTWATLYCYTYRKNLKRAWVELVK